MLPNMDPTRPQGADTLYQIYFSLITSPISWFVYLTKTAFIPPGHPNLGPMQRMSGPRGMGPMGPGPQVGSPFLQNALLLSS